ncbi:MAG: sarcosine oxidase subunit delta [Gemmobacter sp.]
MRLTCPLCGNRDRREFYYYGADDWLERPDAAEPVPVWADWIHLRDNPAGMTRDLWYHEQGCGAWLAVTRDTVTHAIHGVEVIAPTEPAAPAAGTGASGGDISAKSKTPRKKKGTSDAA